MSEWPKVGDKVVIHGLRKEDDHIGYVIGVSCDRKGLEAVFTLEDMKGNFTTRYRSHISRLNQPAWIEHDGKSWPKCHPDDEIIVCREGINVDAQYTAAVLDWGKTAHPVIRYRVIAQAETHD